MKKIFVLFLFIFACSKVEFPWYEGTLEEALVDNNKFIMIDFFATW